MNWEMVKMENREMTNKTVLVMAVIVKRLINIDEVKVDRCSRCVENAYDAKLNE